MGLKKWTLYLQHFSEVTPGRRPGAHTLQEQLLPSPGSWMTKALEIYCSVLSPTPYAHSWHLSEIILITIY